MNWFAETRDNYCPLWFDAMQRAYPERWRVFSRQISGATLVKRDLTPERVAVIISGGGVNGPFIPGFVGEGLADACVVGPPNTAPNAFALYDVARVLGKEKGVLLMYNNFMGDYLNNDMAAEMLALEGVRVEQLACCDDMGMARGEPRENRGGRTVIAQLTKLAAAAAREGNALDDVLRLVRKAHSRSSTLCVSVDTQNNQTTYGQGFSGEPGFLERENATVQSTAEETIRLLIEDVRPQAGERVYMLVNRMRMTSYSDSYVMAGYMADALEKYCPLAQLRVGGYSIITDLYGYTVTLLCADEEIAPYMEKTVCGDGFLL